MTFDVILTTVLEHKQGKYFYSLLRHEKMGTEAFNGLPEAAGTELVLDPGHPDSTGNHGQAVG